MNPDLLPTDPREFTFARGLVEYAGNAGDTVDLLADKERIPLRSERPFTRLEPRGLLFLPATDVECQWLSAVIGSVRQLGPVLLLSTREHPGAFGCGIDILHVADFPGLAFKCIVSASWVVSFCIEPVLVALNHGVPAVFLSLDEPSAEKARQLGAPCVSGSPKCGPSLDRGELEKCLEGIDWELVRSRLQASGAGAGELQKFQRTTDTARRDRGTVPQLSVCCISDTGYIPFLLGLIENLRAVHEGELEIFVLTLDSAVEGLLRSQYSNLRMHFFSLSEMYPPDVLARIQQRSIGLQAMGAKSRLIESALAIVQGPVFYFDLDVYFFESPVSLVADLKDARLLLFPQWSDQLVWARRHGLFNAGMIGVNRGAEAFLQWWSRQCEAECDFDEMQGRFADQTYLDLSLWRFEGIRVYQAQDQNVAPWNLETLGVRRAQNAVGRLTLADGRLVKSYHAAGFDFSGLFEYKYTWDQAAFFFSTGFGQPAPALYDHVLEQQRRHDRRLDELLLLHAVVSRVRSVDNSYPAAESLNPYLAGRRQWILDTWIFCHAQYQRAKRRLRKMFSTVAG